MRRERRWLLTVMGALVAGVLGLAVVPAPAEPAAPPSTRVPVVGAQLVCPDLARVPGTVGTRVSAGTPDRVGNGPAHLLVTPLGGPGAAAVLPAPPAGQVLAGIGGTRSGTALQVTATGPVAAGLEVEQVTRGVSGAQSGLSDLRCPAPGTSAWFVGGAATVGHSATLVLANPDAVGAVVDVTVWTGQGPADPRPGQGLGVPARSRVLVPLDQLAPDHTLLAVHVAAVRGRVAAALRHERSSAGRPTGVDWVPQARPPARTVVVPGLPSGPGRRTLQVTNPGEQDTTVSVQVTTAQGQFVPTGAAAVAVPAGTTVSLDLTAVTPASVRVVSDGPPVLAGAFLDGTRDFAYLGSAGPLTGPALLTDVVLDPPTESLLVLSAPAAAAEVDVVPVPVVGELRPLPGPRRVAVPAGRTVRFALSTLLPPGSRARMGIEVRPVPGGGPVYGSRVLTEAGPSGQLLTALTVQSAVATVVRPAVVADPLVAVSR